MVDSSNLKVKICCIGSIQEADQAIEHGADILGLVSHMPSGPGIISETSIQYIVAHVGHRAETYLLTSKVTCAEIVAQYDKMKPSGIQLVDRLDLQELIHLRSRLPDIDLIQVLHVLDEQIIRDAIKVSRYVNAILLDSGNPNKKIKELGGTGRTHDWKISRFIIEELDLPVFLAGGITVNNVQRAVDTTRPHGIDLCNGVRTDGKLDASKLESFMNKVRTIS